MSLRVSSLPLVLAGALLAGPAEIVSSAESPAPAAAAKTPGPPEAPPTAPSTPAAPATPPPPPTEDSAAKKSKPKAPPANGPWVARTLSDFTGAEEPLRRWNTAGNAFETDSFQNITQPAEGAVRFTLRYFPGQWWDTDRDTDNLDRQRAEVKGLGPAQKRGETFEYATTVRIDPTLRGLGKFCHVFQLKAVDGDNSPPLVALSILRGENTAAVRYWPGGKDAFLVVRQFTLKPDDPLDIRIRVRTSTTDGASDGAVLASIDNDDFQGVHDVAVFRPRATSYRAKWGFYRGFSDELPAGENWVEHRDISVERIMPPAPTPIPSTSPETSAPTVSPPPPSAPPATSNEPHGTAPGSGTPAGTKSPQALRPDQILQLS